MLYRWFAVALTGLPIGMALAERDLSEAPAMAMVEHDLHSDPAQLAESGVERMRQSLRALMLAHRNAYNDGDLMLATCLQALIEENERLMPEALAHVATAAALTSPTDFSAFRAGVASTAEKLDSLLDQAAACVGEDGSSEGTTDVDVTIDGFDSADDVDFGPTGLPSIDPPSVAPGKDGPGTVTTFDPADDMPMVPSTASPMR
jgi:hypothetical protein